MCFSGLLLDAFAKRREDAISRGPAACSSHLACWIPVSGHQEGTACSLRPRLSEEHYSHHLHFPFQIPLMIKQNAEAKMKATVYVEDLA